MPKEYDRMLWKESCHDHYCLIAEDKHEILGFGDITKKGYLDRLFTNANYQRCGVANRLCSMLEEYTFQELAVPSVHVAASITALRFFLDRDYRIITKQQVMRRGIALTNYAMAKYSKQTYE